MSQFKQQQDRGCKRHQLDYSVVKSPNSRQKFALQEVEKNAAFPCEVDCFILSSFTTCCRMIPPLPDLASVA